MHGARQSLRSSGLCSGFDEVGLKALQCLTAAVPFLSDTSYLFSHLLEVGGELLPFGGEAPHFLAQELNLLPTCIKDVGKGSPASERQQEEDGAQTQV